MSDETLEFRHLINACLCSAPWLSRVVSWLVGHASSDNSDTSSLDGQLVESVNQLKAVYSMAQEGTRSSKKVCSRPKWTLLKADLSSAPEYTIIIPDHRQFLSFHSANRRHFDCFGGQCSNSRFAFKRIRGESPGASCGLVKHIDAGRLPKIGIDRVE